MRTNSNIPEYIVAICPNDEVVAEVARLKQQLYNAIGWFGSYRSLAHITIDAFNADNEVLQVRKELLKIFAAEQENYTIVFNTISSFHESRTVFIAPDTDSAQWLNNLGMAYSELFQPSHLQQKFNPHITIGRGIKYKDFSRAKKVFSNQGICLPFLCNNIALRKFDYQRKQYDIIERFYFNGNQEQIR